MPSDVCLCASADFVLEMVWCRPPCAADPLIFHIMDKDTISYDDAIGSVLISLKPLVCGPPHCRPHHISGWFPITDSLVRGPSPLLSVLCVCICVPVCAGMCCERNPGSGKISVVCCWCWLGG